MDMRTGICKRLIFAFFCCMPLTSLAKDIFDWGIPVFETIGDKGSLGSLSLTSLAQDDYGFIWIATDAGIVRYDGYHFKSYTHSAKDPFSIRGHDIRTLLVDKNNNVWAGNYRDGISLLKRKTEKFSHLLQGRGKSNNALHVSVFAMIEQVGVGVWVASTDGLILFDYEGQIIKHHVMTGTNNMLSNQVSALLFDSQKRLLVGSSEGLQVLNTDGTFATLFLGEDELDMRAIFEDSQGQLWVGGDKQALLLLSKEDRLEQLPFPYLVTHISEPIDKQLWVATFNNGIYVLDIETKKVLESYQHDPSLEHSLNYNTVNMILKSRGGLIWIATTGNGLNLLNPHNAAIRNLYHSPSKPALLSGIDILGMKEMQNGEIWLGVYGQGIDVFLPGKGRVKTFAVQPDNASGLTDARIRYIEQTPSGDVWLATRNGLLRYQYSTQQFTTYTTDDGLSSNIISVTCACAYDEGAILVATYKGLNLFYPETRQSEGVYADREGGQFSQEYLELIIRDRHGVLWVAGRNGLFVLSPKTRVLKKIEPSAESKFALPSSNITGLIADADGELIVVNNNGVYQFTGWDQGQEYNKAKFTLMAENDQIEGKLFKDNASRYWGGLSLIDSLAPVDNNTEVLTQADGIGISELWWTAHQKTKSGTLLFGGNTGVMMVKPERYLAWNYHPPLVIASIYQDGDEKTFDPSQSHLALDGQNFTVEFAALDYSAPERLNYAYQLEGYEEEWNNVDHKRRFASYTNLSPGDYTLLVKGTNRKGMWSQHKINLGITVLPLWYQTWWFRTAVLCVICGFLYVLYNLRVRQLKAKGIALEKIVAERTLTLELKTIEATTALQALVETKDKLVESEKHASLGHLVVGISHELNTPLGIAKIAIDQLSLDGKALGDMLQSGKLSKSLFTQKNQSIAEASTLATSSINRAAALVNRFKALSVEQDKVQERDIELVQYIRDAVQSIKHGKLKMKDCIQIHPDSNIHLHTDPEAFLKIITELVANTMQHGFSDGQAIGQIDIRLSLEAGNLLFTYADNGSGIDAADVPLVFDPFYTTARGTEAVGLGLHTVFNLVTRRLHGSIECISRPEQGSEFIMCIPTDGGGEGDLGQR